MGYNYINRRVLLAATHVMSFEEYEYFNDMLDAGRAYAIVTRAKTDQGIARAAIRAFDMDRESWGDSIFDVAAGRCSLNSICGDGYQVYRGRNITVFVVYSL